MNTEFKLNKSLLILGVPLCLLITMYFLMESPLLIGNRTLQFAITFDLLIFIPCIHLLLIRKTTIPKTTAIPIMIIGSLLGTYILPSESQMYLSLYKTWFLPVVEITVLSFVIFKIRKVNLKFKNIKEATPDFFTALKSTCYEILPKKVVIPFATEIAVFYYGFFNWKTKELKINEFTYHKNSGTPTLFGAFILIIAIETVALHFLLASWSIIAAWILTALSIYTAIQIFGFVKSLTKRPISIDDNYLHIKYGILNETKIPFSNISNISLSNKTLNKENLERSLSPLGELESHNVIIKLHTKSELTGLYGMKTKFIVLGLQIDKSIEFKDRIDEKLTDLEEVI